MTARKPAKVTLCRECVVEGPWRFDDAGNAIGKCPQCFPPAPTATPEAERDAALAQTAEANPDALRDALRIIRDTAHAMPIFSANDCRYEMNLADIPGPVRGAAFRQAIADRWIRAAGYVASSQQETHGHPVKSYESLIFGHQAGRAS